jgi:hypothetical protein
MSEMETQRCFCGDEIGQRWMDDKAAWVGQFADDINLNFDAMG